MIVCVTAVPCKIWIVTLFMFIAIYCFTFLSQFHKFERNLLEDYHLFSIKRERLLWWQQMPLWRKHGFKAPRDIYVLLYSNKSLMIIDQWHNRYSFYCLIINYWLITINYDAGGAWFKYRNVIFATLYFSCAIGGYKTWTLQGSRGFIHDPP